ncbi:MAG: uracil-DNA glycosylase [Brevundimonas subvibrioides]|uniref:Uracil-DNA glycosylase n=1 Tax=Brevundimonas subvibrioides TaxID=74313 RepID=A0A258HHD6_9CAUL|nr:MAG: uracil-DNA glycosylase [Brevundimonas subvibrioides]
MKSEQVRAERRAMLALPHIATLATFAADLRVRHGVEVPDFDPMDGGVHARMLFLKEKPGPMTSASRSGRAGSGFISRDNDDPTAESTFRFMEAAGIPRQDTLMWNVVPGWNGTRKITRQELAEGAAEVRNLMALLPDIEVVVLVGKKAAKAAPLLSRTGVAIFRSLHSSPLVRASRPADWARIPDVWAEAARALRPNEA